MKDSDHSADPLAEVARKLEHQHITAYTRSGFLVAGVCMPSAPDMLMLQAGSDHQAEVHYTRMADVVTIMAKVRV